MPTVRRAEIIARKPEGSSGSRIFEVVTSRGDESFWVQVYERVREIEQAYGLRVKSISIEER